jgi:hypothetical protein
MSFTKAGSGATVFSNAIGSVKTSLTGTPLFTQLSTSATSSAVGAFSLRAVNGTSARAVNVRAQAQFPPSAMTSAAVVSGGGLVFTQTLSGGFSTGQYVVSCSRYDYGWSPRGAFDLSDVIPFSGGIIWQVNSAYTTGSYTGATTTAGYGGEWIQVQVPSLIKITSYYFMSVWTDSFVLLGSTDASTWTLIDTQTGIVDAQKKTVTGLNPSYYSYYRFVITKSYTNVSYPGFNNIILYGSNASWNTDFYADRLGNLLTAPVTGQSLASWLGGATGYVTTWYDQSGAGNHMSCSSAGIQPKIDLVNNFIDLKTSAYFDVSAGTTGPVPFQSSKNYTVVFRHGQFVGSGLFCATQNAAGPYGNLVNNFKKGTGPTYTQYWYGNDVVNKGVLATGNRVSYKWDGTNRSLYVNGTLADATPSSGWSQTSSSIQMIGKTNFDATMNGELYGAFMFTSALSDTDRTLLENFL